MSAIPTTPAAAAENDFATEIIARRKRRKVPRLTLVLGATVIACAVFIGGVEAQKHLGSSAAASTGRGGFAGAAAFARGGGFSRGAGAAAASAFLAGGFGGGGATVGTVTLIKGTSLYVTDSTGNTVLVKTTAGTPVTKTVTASESTIRPGDTVSFAGAQGSDGSYSPRAITITSGGGGSGG